MLDSIRSFTRHRTRQSLDLLRELVDIPTGVGDFGGLERCVEVVDRELRGLSFSVHRRKTDGGPVLVAERPAQGDDAPVVLFLAHLDTVFRSSEAGFELHEARATGPGVADMKGGVVVGLDVVRALDHVDCGGSFRFLILMNSDEESSSTCSRPVIEEIAEQADLVLVFEPARPTGAIVTARRGLRRYRITVQGRAAHAGVEPENGASAIEALARKVVAFQELNQARPDLNVNVGTIRGGSNPNVVPESAGAEIDVRLSTMETARWVHEKITEIVRRNEVPGTHAIAEVYAERPPMTSQTGMDQLLDVYTDVATRLGMPLEAVATGGGSDGNFTAALGKLTLDGLGPVGGGYHSEREFVLIDSVAERAALTAGVLAAIARMDPRPGWLGGTALSRR